MSSMLEEEQEAGRVEQGGPGASMGARSQRLRGRPSRSFSELVLHTG